MCCWPWSLVLGLALISLAGCGKKAEVETDPAVETAIGEATEEVPEPPVPEETDARR